MARLVRPKMFRRSPSKDRMWRDDRRQLHRRWGPAVENADGSKRWYWRGIAVYEEFRNESQGFMGLGLDDTVCRFMTCNWEGGWTWGREWRLNGSWVEPDNDWWHWKLDRREAGGRP